MAAERTPAAPFAISRAYRRYALGLLLAVYTVNYVDRQILSILLEPIKLEFGLEDWELGILTGFAFAAFYATLGMPIAWWADRGNRRDIIAIATAIFSGMTFVCGLAASYAQLLLARIGVGIGEAGSSPPSHSIIADLYPPAERSTAMAVFALGVNIGLLIGYLLGGWVSELAGWRQAFWIVGLPGLALALVVRLTLPEPPRGHSEASSAQAAAPSFREVVRFIWSQPSLRHIIAGVTLVSFVGYGGVAWLPPFYARVHDMGQGAIGTALALIIGFGGGLGTFLGGWIADRVGRSDVANVPKAIAWAYFLGWPFALGLYLAESAWLSLAFLMGPAFVGAFFLGPSLSLGQGLVALRMRTVTSAIILFVLNIVGLGLGPTAIGALSSWFEPALGENSLRWAFLTVSVLYFWGGAHFFRAGRTLRADLARAAALRG
jgi:predicted MFS family arabinose efflux permease